MMLKEIIEALQAKVLLNKVGDEVKVELARASDLMSDVLHRTKPAALLLTGLTTPQSIYAAEMADVVVVCYVRGKRPPAETMRLAEERGLVLLSTKLPMYESCGRLYRMGLKGGTET
jgi:hypothetical protein